MAEHDTITIKKSTMRIMTIALVALLIGISFAGGYFLGSSGTSNTAGTNTIVAQQQPTQQAQPQQQAAPPGRTQVSLDDDPQIGDKNAGLVIIEFSDFQCPFCGRFFTQTLPQIKSEYIDTGKVLLVYRDFPLDSIHPQATPAALAANCANEQGKFWEYHDKIFENQQSMSDANYKAWAAELKLNTDQFNQCFDSQKYLTEVTKDFQEGSNTGVSGTPTFYIGNPQKGYVELVGAQPYSVFKQVIDQELAA